MPCYNLRICDVEYVYKETACQRLVEPCPICMIHDENIPRLVVPCCEQNFCAKCLATHLCASSTCPMCRATLDLSDCTSVSETHISILGDILHEAKNFFGSVLEDPEARVLVVSGTEILYCPCHLVAHVGIDYVLLDGNMQTIKKRVSSFSRGAPKVAIIFSPRMGLASIRLPNVSHVVFLGYTSQRDIAHWSLRSYNPMKPNHPKCYLLESAYSKVTQCFDEFNARPV